MENAPKHQTKSKMSKFHVASWSAVSIESCLLLSQILVEPPGDDFPSEASMVYVQIARKNLARSIEYGSWGLHSNLFNMFNDRFVHKVWDFLGNMFGHVWTCLICLMVWPGDRAFWSTATFLAEASPTPGWFLCPLPSTGAWSTYWSSYGFFELGYTQNIDGLSVFSASECYFEAYIPYSNRPMTYVTAFVRSFSEKKENSVICLVCLVRVCYVSIDVQIFGLWLREWASSNGSTIVGSSIFLTPWIIPHPASRRAQVCLVLNENIRIFISKTLLDNLRGIWNKWEKCPSKSQGSFSCTKKVIVIQPHPRLDENIHPWLLGHPHINKIRITWIVIHQGFTFHLQKTLSHINHYI